LKVEDVERIDAASLRILDEVGVRQSEMTLSLAQLEHHRRELFSPRLLNRRPRGACPGPLHEVAAARAGELLSANSEPALSEDERSALLAVERAFAGD